MEVHLSPDLQDKLTRLAEQQGRDRGSLAAEAIARMVDYDEWFLSQVDQGLTDIANGQTLSHDAVGEQLNTLIARKQARV